MAKKADKDDSDRFENLILIIIVGSFLTGFGMATLLNLLRPNKKAEE